MTTTGQQIDKNRRYKGTNWEEESVDVASSEALLLDSDSNPLVFLIEQYDIVTLQVTNKDNSTNATMKIYLSNFDDPGSTFATDFSTDSQWVQAKDEDGADLSITLTATGTPANNELYRMEGVYKWMALTGSASSSLTNALDIALFFVKRG